MRLLKNSTARNIMIFMTDSTDHVSGKASLSLTITSSQDGGAFGSISPTVTDRSNGWYELALTTAHTNTNGDLALHITATGADPTDVIMQVVTDLPGDTITTVTGNVNGSVGSVTGAVGSVTGAVGSVTANVTVGGYAAGQAPLQPSVSGRTLGVNSSGQAGIDWANLGGASTTNNLSGTTISTVTNSVGSVTGAVGSVTGAVGSVTGNVGGNVIGSVASVTGAVGSVTGLTAANLDVAVSTRLSSTLYLGLS